MEEMVKERLKPRERERRTEKELERRINLKHFAQDHSIQGNKHEPTHSSPVYTICAKGLLERAEVKFKWWIHV